MRIFLGILLVAIGVIFLGENLDWFYFDLGRFIDHYWPLVIIGVGIWLMVKQGRHSRWSGNYWAQFSGDKFSKTMGDVRLKPTSIDATGLRVDQGMGEVEIDLTATTLQPGVNNVECHLGLGDIKIILSNNVPIAANCTAGIGDVKVLGKDSSGFGAKITHQDPDYANADKKVNLTAKVGLGDVRVSRT